MAHSRRAVIGAAAAAAAMLLGAADRPPVPVPRPERVAAVAAANEAAGKVSRRQSGISGWMAVDLDTGEVVDAHDADRPFAPASVAKLPTAFYALDRLGPDHRFETRLAVTGRVEGATLLGDAILEGGGDPELDSDELLPLAESLKALGIRHVAGRFLVDGSAGPRVDAIGDGQPVDAAYNPAVSGLNLNFNRVRLKWNARGKERTLRVSAKAQQLDPDVNRVRIALATDPGAPMFSHSIAGGTEFWQMNQAGFRGEGARWLPVRQPELYAGEVFQALAATHEIRLEPAREGQAPGDARVVARHQSRELLPMLRSMLRYSTNLTAEMVGYAASRAGGAPVTSPAQSAAAMNAWAAAVAGFPPGDPGFGFTNHSGLATGARVSPRRMVELLAALARRDPPADGSGGLPATADALLRDYNVAVKSVKLDYKHLEIAAKTGTMDYVRGLAGYIVTPSGRRLAFAIFSNDIERRPDIAVERIDRRWMARAREFERALIRSWVKSLER